MKKISFWILITVTYFNSAHAQISIAKDPYSYKNEINYSNIETKLLPALDYSILDAEDQKDYEDGIPPRFGYPHEVDLNLKNSGTWIKLPNGDRLWLLKIECPDAISINLLYDRFWLPEDAGFHIFSEDQKKKIGMFSSRNNKGSRESNRGFATGLVFSDNIILEYYEPKNVEGQGIISIAKVVHGYREIGVENFGDSGGCQVNINCSPEGDNWQNEKQSVAVILVNGTRWCTGSLINNVNSNGESLFLTADHCIYPNDAINDSNLDTWSFLWNYESQNCNNGVDFSPSSTSGATIVANNAETDFALLSLDEHPLDDNIDVYFNGWNRNNTQPANGVGIHHPSGDIKKISTHNIIPNTSNCMDFNYHNHFLPNDAFWRINWQQTTNGHSVTEGGSSGSPLYSSNHRVVGQLFGAGLCDNPNCSDPSNDIANYGRISSSWNRHATEPRRRLRDWLDPDNTITDLAGLRLIRNRTINTNTPASGDIVRFENVSVQNGSNITVVFDERFETTGTFMAPAGTTLKITPNL